MTSSHEYWLARPFLGRFREVYVAAVRDPDEPGAVGFVNGIGVALRAGIALPGVLLIGVPTFLSLSGTWSDVGLAIALTGVVGAAWCTLRIALSGTGVPNKWLVPWDADLVWQAIVAALIVRQLVANL